jgi:hypothetical protein
MAGKRFRAMLVFNNRLIIIQTEFGECPDCGDAPSTIEVRDPLTGDRIELVRDNAIVYRRMPKAPADVTLPTDREKVTV